MATLALISPFAYVGGHDFTADMNQWRLSAEAQPKECTNARSGGWREYKLGPKSSNLDLAGHYQAGDAQVDPHIFDNLGVAGQVITTGPQETEAVTAFLHRGMQPTLTLLGSYGEIAPFQVTALGDDGATGVVKGQLAVKMATLTTTGAKGTAVDLGLVGSGRYLYASLHLLGTAGTSITAVVESDETGGFATPTTRITFGPLTAVGGYWGTRVAGPIALDTLFRLNVTAITGTWTIASAIGIGY